MKLRTGAKATGRQQLIELLKEDAGKQTLQRSTEPLRRDPSLLLAPLGMSPDPWQREVLTSTADKVLLLCSRQSGKSQTMAALALLEAILHPHAEVLILSRTLRQSVELLRKVKELWRGLVGGRVLRRQRFKPPSLRQEAEQDKALVQAKGWDGAALVGEEFKGEVKDKALSMDFPNYSRITSLPGSPDTIVGFSAVTLLIVDEAARVPDALYNLIRPFLTVTKEVHGRPGRMVVASTPFGKRGWFYEAWNNCEKASDAYAKGKAAGEAGRSKAVVEALYSGGEGWLRHHWLLGYNREKPAPPFKTFRVTAEDCPRIDKAFLEEERAQIGDRWFRQEYMTEFVDSIDSVFSRELVHAMVQDTGGEEKLWFE